MDFNTQFLHSPKFCFTYWWITAKLQAASFIDSITCWKNIPHVDDHLHPHSWGIKLFHHCPCQNFNFLTSTKKSCAILPKISHHFFQNAAVETLWYLKTSHYIDKFSCLSSIYTPSMLERREIIQEVSLDVFSPSEDCLQKSFPPVVLHVNHNCEHYIRWFVLIHYHHLS